MLVVPGGFLDLENWNNYNSNWKKLSGLKNLQEKLEKSVLATSKRFWTNFAELLFPS